MTELRATVDGIDVPTGHLIGGEWVGSATTFESRSPLDWTGEPRSLTCLVATPTLRPQRSPQRSRDSRCGVDDVAERAEVLHRLADLIEAHNDDIATSSASTWDSSSSSRCDCDSSPAGRSTSAPTPTSSSPTQNAVVAKGMDNHVQRMPAGPAVVITPWNAPFMLSTWKLARHWPPATP
jgi:acyl-CoA reductase-like NAD-dependent aldehyde dehydrogenase